MNSVKKVLILSLNPNQPSRLKFDEEVREIDEGLRRAKHRDQLDIKSTWAIRLTDFRNTLLEYEPYIVHFSGHGKEEDLLVEDEGGMTVRVSEKALSELFALCSKHVKCVILSAGYSASQATTISKYIDYVIGMKREIKVGTAIVFAMVFYDALGVGKSIEEAFKFGCNAILDEFPDLPDHLMPILKKRKGLKNQKNKR